LQLRKKVFALFNTCKGSDAKRVSKFGFGVHKALSAAVALAHAKILKQMGHKIFYGVFYSLRQRAFLRLNICRRSNLLKRKKKCTFEGA